MSLDIKIDYSDSTARLMTGPPSDEFRRWLEEMQKTDNIEAAIERLEAERAIHVRKIEDLDTTIKTLKQLGADNGNSISQTMVVHNAEFAGMGIAETAVTMIRRAGRPLHVKEIAEGLTAGGYKFKGDNPLNSIAPVLFLAAKNKKHGIVNKGKNTYSIKEIEERSKN